MHTRSLKDFTPTTHTDEALQQQKEMEEPTVSALAPRVEDRIVPMFRPEYGVGRVSELESEGVLEANFYLRTPPFLWSY